MWLLHFALFIYSLESFADVLRHSVKDRQGPLKFAPLKCVIIIITIIIIIMMTKMKFQIYALAKVLLNQHLAIFSMERKAAGASPVKDFVFNSDFVFCVSEVLSGHKQKM